MHTAANNYFSFAVFFALPLCHVTVVARLSLCSIYGMIWRVSVGAALSMLDAATDIYIISKYYNTEGLRGQTNAMLAMIVTSMGIQIIVVLFQYKKKNWGVKMKEVLICLFFLRPIVDAYRVSTNCKDSEAMFDPLLEMMMNKVRDCVRTSATQNHSADNALLICLIHFALHYFLSYRASSLLVSQSLVVCCRSSFC